MRWDDEEPPACIVLHTVSSVSAEISWKIGTDWETDAGGVVEGLFSVDNDLTRIFDVEFCVTFWYIVK